MSEQAKTTDVRIEPLASPWGRFALYSFVIDAPELTVVDTGIASSPAEGIAPALERLGRRVEDVRWILLTHGHIDHIGGAHALWEMTGRRANVVIHEADAHLLRSRRAHVDQYLQVRGRYLRDPHGEDRQAATAVEVISGTFKPSIMVTGGEVLDLGDGVTVSVHHVPGHTAGSAAYEVTGQGAVFVGDAVQVHGAANGFPGYEDPLAYRASLRHLLEQVRPQHLYLGHPYRTADGSVYDVALGRDLAEQVLEQSLEIEDRIAAAADRHLSHGLSRSDSVYSPFEAVAQQMAYEGDPTLEPSPFFTTLHGYARALGVLDDLSTLDGRATCSHSDGTR